MRLYGMIGCVHFAGHPSTGRALVCNSFLPVILECLCIRLLYRMHVVPFAFHSARIVFRLRSLAIVGYVYVVQEIYLTVLCLLGGATMRMNIIPP